MRARASSTLRILQRTSSPGCTTASGVAMRSQESSLMWISPCSCSTWVPTGSHDCWQREQQVKWESLGDGDQVKLAQH